MFFILLNILSCSFIDKTIQTISNGIDSIRNYEFLPKKVRVVDLDGNYKPIKRKIPEFNAKVLSGDLNIIEDSNTIANNNPSNATKINSSVNIISNKTLVDKTSPELKVSANDNIKKKKTVIEYDLSESTEETRTRNKVVSNISNKRTFIKDITNSDKKSIFVQIGVFSSLNGASATLKKASVSVSKGIIKEVVIKNKVLQRVLLGPLKNKQEAKELRKKAVGHGYKDAFIVEYKIKS